jgi:hypothetical protein
MKNELNRTFRKAATLAALSVVAAVPASNGATPENAEPQTPVEQAVVKAVTKNADGTPVYTTRDGSVYTVKTVTHTMNKAGEVDTSKGTVAEVHNGTGGEPTSLSIKSFDEGLSSDQDPNGQTSTTAAIFMPDVTDYKNASMTTLPHPNKSIGAEFRSYMEAHKTNTIDNAKAVLKEVRSEFAQNAITSPNVGGPNVPSKKGSKIGLPTLAR